MQFTCFAYAISEFAYVRSLQLCHAYAPFAYMQHYSSNICNIRVLHMSIFVRVS